MDEGRKLPAPDFCNKKGAGKENPIFGKGALGNQFQSRMFYTGSDTEELVTLVQKMLSDPALGYDVGPKGADGKFGDDTEKAVKKFQKEHEDWHGDALNVDGLVGPETADALNRAMVGGEGWYESHQTETSLTIDFSLLTTMAPALKEPVSMDVKGVKKGKIVLLRNIIKSNKYVFSVRLHGTNCQPLGNVIFRVLTYGIESSGISDPEGWVHIKISKDQCYEHITLEWEQNEPSVITLRKDLIMDCEGYGEENQQALARLHNIGYSIDIYSTFENAVKAFQNDYFIPGEYGVDDKGNLPPLTKKFLWYIYGEGGCDAATGSTKPDDPSVKGEAEGE